MQSGGGPMQAHCKHKAELIHLAGLDAAARATLSCYGHPAHHPLQLTDYHHMPHCPAPTGLSPR